jgi:hypothetical protein
VVEPDENIAVVLFRAPRIGEGAERLLGSTLLGLMLGVPFAAMVISSLMFWAAIEYRLLERRRGRGDPQPGRPGSTSTTSSAPGTALEPMQYAGDPPHHPIASRRAPPPAQVPLHRRTGHPKRARLSGRATQTWLQDAPSEKEPDSYLRAQPKQLLGAGDPDELLWRDLRTVTSPALVAPPHHAGEKGLTPCWQPIEASCLEPPSPGRHRTSAGLAQRSATRVGERVEPLGTAGSASSAGSMSTIW